MSEIRSDVDIATDVANKLYPVHPKMGMEAMVARADVIVYGPGAIEEAKIIVGNVIDPSQGNGE